MHESSIARQLLSVVLDRARREGATKVRAARGWIAETEALSPESIEMHFAAHARGTPAEGASLDLELVRVDARCGSCAAVFTPDHHVASCPTCGGVAVELLGPVGICLSSMEVD